MKINKYIIGILLFLLGADLVFSFFQYLNQTLDGDLAGIALPGGHYSRVLADPLGYKVFLSGDGYSGAGRFTAHFFTYHYIRVSSAFFRWFLHPVEALYIGIAVLKWLIHLSIVFLISRLAIAHKNNTFSWIVALVFCSALFINGRFAPDFTLILNSPIYTIYYTLPLVAYFIFFGPMLLYLIRGRFVDISNLSMIGLIFLALILPQSSPIQPPLIILSILSFLLVEWYPAWKKKDFAGFKKILGSKYLMVCGFILLSAFYAYYVGSFNKESGGEKIALIERYRALGQGLIKYFFKSVLVLPVLIFSLVILRFGYRPMSTYPLKKLWGFVILLVAMYTVLLPLGGTRWYRPLLIRGDTYILTTALLVLLFVSTLVRSIKFEKISIKAFVLACVMLSYFYVIDLDGIGKNQCEKSVLYQAHDYKGEDDLVIPYKCEVCAWGPMRNKYLAKVNTDFWWALKIVDHDFLILNE